MPEDYTQMLQINSDEILGTIVETGHPSAHYG